MRNPFVYGKEVTREHFCNRSEEIKALSTDIMNTQNVLLYSPRRYGKTSLIREVFRLLKGKGIKTVFVDIYPALDEADFIKIFASAIPACFEGGIDKVLKLTKSLFSRMIPQFTLDDKGKPIFQFSFDTNKDTQIYLEDIFTGLSVYSEKHKIVIVFDEFQQINCFTTDRIERILRSHIQQQQNIAYIFMGSQKHLIYDMFNNPNRPFYRSTKHFILGKIGVQEFSNFIRNRFKATHKNISEELAEKIVVFCEQHPYYVQYLSNIVWEFTEAEVNEELFTESVKVLLERESTAFENIWNLLTIRQRQLLKLLAILPVEKSLYNHSPIRLPSSTIFLTLKSLQDKELIYKDGKKYQFTDLIFKKWVERQVIE